ncbi:sulfatase family protein [Pelagicoccus mobilis]|nr:sulfatase-like hydrolase/transferase [Pelagicoccus mobilis]
MLITTDEQRRDTLGIYGCEAISTPHIDSIGLQGECFDQAYTVSPWCMPSRCSILTGMYPHSHGAYSNFSGDPLDPEIPNLYTSARTAGYSTAHFGKCHYERVRYGTFSPERTSASPGTRDYYMSLGIDHLALQDDKNVSIWQYDDYSRELETEELLDAYRRKAWNRKEGGVFEFPGQTCWHPDAWVGRKAREYIDEWNGERDLFVWLSFSGPHYPIDPPKEYLARVDQDRLPPIQKREGEWDHGERIHESSYHGPGKIDGCGYLETRACKDYDEEYWKRMRTHYLANMALIDEQVGSVLSAANRTFGNDSLIMFTSDHGDMLGNHGLWGKHNCAYDEVLRVPFLMKRPGAGGEGRRISERIQTIDIFPTISDWIGAGYTGVDGVTIDETVAGGGYEYTLAEGEGYYCVDDGRYRLVRAVVERNDSPVYELYDRIADPHLYNNLYRKGEFNEVFERLRGKVEEQTAICEIL